MHCQIAHQIGHEVPLRAALDQVYILKRKASLGSKENKIYIICLGHHKCIKVYVRLQHCGLVGLT